MTHSAFSLVRTQRVASLNLNVEEYVHNATGAQHIHLSPDNTGDESENVFLVALRTVPHDSTGVAHILEHTALCGSEKYPVRDPFFMMTRRSINTFMNAFTSSDWTAYPFASLNKKDFNNLLDVYLDAVFFSKLDELDFAQEGHRLEYKTHDDTSSGLEYKGVVFNEMKGAMSSVPSQLWQTMSKYLFPTTTYHFNSGGEPDCIPDLTYEQLQDFYKTHYHPSNAIFMTYGDISAVEHQAKFEEQALKHFEKLDYVVAVEDEKRYYAPVKVEERYPNSDEDISEKTHVVVGWLLGKSTELRDTLRAQLLSSVLLDNSASPLMHAIESSDLGQAPSPMCGLDDSQKELSFMCGIAGCKEDSADKVEALVRSTLEKVAESGIPAEDIESAIHQLELRQREVGGDSYPYGLQLIMTALTNATHRGDPVGLLNIDDELEQLRKDAQSPEFIKTLTRELLLENPHCVRLNMVPDASIAERKQAAEKAKLAAIENTLTDAQKQAIVEQATALKQRQKQVDDESILPKVTLADVPESESSVDGVKAEVGQVPLTQYSAGTNGLVYQQVIYDLPAIDDDLLPLLPLYSSLVTELGVGEQDYLAMQRKQAKVCGSFNAFSSIRGNIDDANQTSHFFTFSGKALARNQAELTELMHETIASVRFDEHSRIEELVAQIATHQEQSVTGSGHALAMLAASATAGASSQISHRLSGLAAIQSMKALRKGIKQSDQLAELADRLHKLHQCITSAPKQLLLVGEEQHLGSYKNGLAALGHNNATANAPFTFATQSGKIQQAWLTSAQVNYCAKSFPTVTMGHADAAALTVLGGFLRNGFLHTAIREQGGAYGGGASQDSNGACFRFYSYRDPRLGETLQDFDASIDWLLTTEHSAHKVEEAILGTISSLDKSESPAGKAKRCFHADLHGRFQEKRQTFREQILATTAEDLQRVARSYLTPEKANTAVVTGSSQKAAVSDLGLDCIDL